MRSYRLSGGMLTFMLIVLNLGSMIAYGQTKQHSFSRKFVHPGMMQSRQDLEYMKEKVLAGQYPWKNAFDSLKNNTPANFKPKPYSHISVGPYGANSIGGAEFSKSGDMAYNNALMWYITREKKYADKAAEILNAWSYTLWGFDDNNAKLNVGLSGPSYLNAAEILKYANAGWKEKDMEQFKRMVMTVFYPTIKDFFTEANGNWDASIINTLLCIGVFTDDHEIFNSAVERYYYGPGNSGITKYIYPNGQIQETTRDWDHVQLGIGEFAKAAQVAWTHGLDFYGAAGNRLALGFEYCSRFMLGDDTIPVYGVLSVRARNRYRDIYESLFEHYTKVKGLEIPYTKKVINEHTRASSSIGVLTGLRHQAGKIAGEPQPIGIISKIPPVISLVGALKEAVIKYPENAIMLSPGDAIQSVLDANAGKGTFIVLKKGIYSLKQPLVIPSGITLAGQGKESILTLAPELRGKTIANRDKDMHDVTIRDLLIEGAVNPVANTDPNADRRTRSYMNAASREGVVFLSDDEHQMHNVRFEHVTVQNFTKSGVNIQGAKEVVIINCDFSDNGASVVPGAGFHHNLNLLHVSDVNIANSRFDSSPWGSGINLMFGHNVILSNNEAGRNKLSGIRCAESQIIKITGNLTEGNDENGILLDELMNGNSGAAILNNQSGYNGKKEIAVTGKNTVVKNNTSTEGLK